MTVPEELPEPRPEDLVLLRTEETRFEAGVLVAVLESAGIEAVVMDSSSPTEGVAFRPPASGVPVSVRYADIETARATVARHDEDTVDLDWDEVDVGGRADDLPLTPLGHLPSAARLAFIVAVITLVVGLVGAITVLLMG
ncbi:MAG: hypothetical protein GY715_10285 [Planctomycetes bacterium]|nr:hypothetical protein [Planctomycetota bacterium]